MFVYTNIRFKYHKKLEEYIAYMGSLSGMITGVGPLAGIKLFGFFYNKHCI